MGENEVIERENRKDITVVLDVGDVGDVLGLGGGIIGEPGLNLGVGPWFGSQTATDSKYQSCVQNWHQQA